MAALTRSGVRWIGLGLGPLLAIVTYVVLPETYTRAGATVSFSTAGRATAAVTVLMAVWWMTEAIEIFATAFLPLALLPLVGARSIDEAASPYANELIFLFLGGFVLALSMQRWGLERRIARIALRFVGTDPHLVIGGFMVMTAVFSMWVSNTATVAMMLPVCLAVIEAVVPGGRAALLAPVPPPGRRFALGLLLGIAISASIGGVGTLIGTPPNLFLASFARETLGVDISFVEWLAVGIPIVLIFLPLAWLLLTRVLFRPDVDRDRLDTAIRGLRDEQLGRPRGGEIVTFVVFVMTAMAWMTRPLLNELTIGGARPFRGLTDAGIAVLAALALFVIPVDRARHEFTMDWVTARQLPWGILILFGGGLSLAAAIDATGVAEYLGAQAGVLDGLPVLLVVVAIVAGVVFLTELTSNTATTAALLPVLAAVAPGMGADPLLLIVPTAIAASLAFMLPVATPPNAIVFGSGYVTMSQMMRCGFWLNLISIVIVTVATYLIAVPVLGIVT